MLGGLLNTRTRICARNDKNNASHHYVGVSRPAMWQVRQGSTELVYNAMVRHGTSALKSVLQGSLALDSPAPFSLYFFT
jgi:hypothetical protein